MKKTKKTEREKVMGKTKTKIIERVSSGIKKFDDMCEGGFVKNSINLVVGGSGSGKTIFSMEYLMDGIKRGENVLYISFEESKEEFYNNMKEFGWNLEEAEKKRNFYFLEYSPEKVKRMLDEGGGAIESLVYKHNIKRMVIDSITSFMLLFDDEPSRRRAVLSLFDIIRKWNLTTILTLQKDPLEEKDDGYTSIELRADSSILFYFLKDGAKRHRFIEILKMRGTNHSKETREFKIDNGIVIGKVKDIGKI